MHTAPAQVDPLEALEARQQEVIDRINELNRKAEQLLLSWTRSGNEVERRAA